MTDTTRADLQYCQDWRRSHPDTPRWRAYYVAFEIKHGHPSGDNEFDPKLSQMVGAIVDVLRASISHVMR